MTEFVSSNPINVRFYPDYRELNPYQELLYRSLGPTVRATPLADFEQLVADVAGHVSPILHLHWETAAMSHGGMSATRFLDTLSRFRDLGGRIVWTMHNLMPHDARNQSAAEEVRNGLMTLADIIHLHSLPALAAVMGRHALPLHKVRIVAHGNYDGIYPILSRAAARSALGLDNTRTVVLLAGQIRASKAPDAMVNAFCDVAGPDDRLILAGHRMPDVAELSFPDDARIIKQFGFQTNEAFAQIHAAADFVVLPYTASLTSGSAILAHTLGRAVLGSDTPGLRDAVEMPGTGLLYDPSTPGALVEALRAALAEEPAVWETRGRAAARAAAARDWSVQGAAWRSLFAELAGMCRPARVLAP